jgi:hypothetical protein
VPRSVRVSLDAAEATELKLGATQQREQHAEGKVTMSIETERRPRAATAGALPHLAD